MKLRTLLLLTAGFCFCFLLAGYVTWKREVIGPVIAPNLLGQLREGMSMLEVQALLGKPTQQRTHNDTRYPTRETWYYERTLNVGYVAVFFDHDQRLYSMNDESAFPQEYPFELRSE